MNKIAILALTADADWGVPSWRVPAAPGDVTPEGEALFQRIIEDGYEAVVLQHWPLRSAVDRLYDAGVHVYLWQDVEAVPRFGYWSPQQAAIGAYMLAHRLTSSRPNSFGEYFIDPYEHLGPDTPEKRHPHIVRVTPGYATGLMQLVAEALQQYGGRATLLVDNCLPRQYMGSATNVDPLPPDYEQQFVAGFDTFLSLCRKLNVWKLAGNCPADVDLYPYLDLKWDELGMGTTSAFLIAERVERSVFRGTSQRRGLVQGLALEPSGVWLTSTAKWAELREELERRRIDDLVSAVSWRSGVRYVRPDVVDS